MARDLTSGFITEIEAKSLRIGYFVKLFYDSATVFCWTGYGSKVWDGDTYTGLGDLGNFGRIEESQIVRATGIALVLAGFNSSFISLALQEDYQGRKAEIYFAVFDSTGAVIADPHLVFSGNMDQMEIEDQAETATLTISVENELIDLFKPRLRYYTSEDQKTQYPSDLGLDFIAFIQDAEVVWKDKVK